MKFIVPLSEGVRGLARSKRFTLRQWPVVAMALAWLAASLIFAPAARSSEPISWWKGNLHTHTLWSDGDDYPEMVVDWYKAHGYHFLVLSDHNITQEGEKWVSLGTNKTAAIALQKYLDRFPSVANQLRTRGGTDMVRLKTLQEFRGLYEEPDHF